MGPFQMVTWVPDMPARAKKKPAADTATSTFFARVQSAAVR
jgi:hypothetical protein